MGLEVMVASGATYIAVVLAFGVFLWRVFARMLHSIENRFDGIDRQFDNVDSLSRELSEFRGEVRGRLAAVLPEP